jgi:hypothetical protein
MTCASGRRIWQALGDESGRADARTVYSVVVIVVLPPLSESTLCFVAAPGVSPAYLPAEPLFRLPYWFADDRRCLAPVLSPPLTHTRS